MSVAEEQKGFSEATVDGWIAYKDRLLKEVRELTSRVAELERERAKWSLRSAELELDMDELKAKKCTCGGFEIAAMVRDTNDILRAKVRELEAAARREQSESTSLSELLELRRQVEAHKSNASRDWDMYAKAVKERDAARAKAEAFQKEVENCKASSAVFNPQQSPDSLSAILRELAEEGIWCSVAVGVGDDNCYQVVVSGVHPDSRSNLAESDVAAFIESATIKAHPNSSFARRRAATVEAIDPIAAMLAINPAPWTYDEEMDLARDVNRDPVMVNPAIVAAVNAYQPPQAAEPISMLGFQQVDHPSPAGADPVREMLAKYPGDWRRWDSRNYEGEWWIKNDSHCKTARLADTEVETVDAICEMQRRYRAIESAVNGSSFVRETIMSNLGGSTWESLHAALRPLLRTSEKEA